MRLGIAAIGKAKPGPHEALTSDYLGRAQALGRSLGLNGPDLKAMEAPRALPRSSARQAREADLLRDAIPPDARLILLDERGKDRSSRELAGLIGAQRDQGTPALFFLIGGADGFPAEFRAELRPRTVQSLAFGRATWPHRLVRAMLAEQIYRAATILAGHPYHRD